MRLKILLSVILVVLSGCGLLSSAATPEFCLDEIAAVQDFGGITLPPSYQGLRVQCSALMDHHSLYARFDMAPADLEAFQASTLIDSWTVKGENAPEFDYSFGDFLDERGLAALDAYVYGVHVPLVPVAQQIVIDTSNPENYVVYLSAFTSF